MPHHFMGDLPGCAFWLKICGSNGSAGASGTATGNPWVAGDGVGCVGTATGGVVSVTGVTGAGFDASANPPGSAVNGGADAMADGSGAGAAPPSGATSCAQRSS